jgi:hydroxypyruvate isomerase
VRWCFSRYWDIEQMARIASQLGCLSVELVPATEWETLKRHGLICALAGSHSFVQGMNNPKYQAGCIDVLKKSIDNCADAGFPAVITFTGFAKETGAWAGGSAPASGGLPLDSTVVDPEEGIQNCVRGYKQIVSYAEKKNVSLSLEMLNSRVDETMKGHPGYQGDHIDYCMKIINQVGSPRLGLLFDIYHVQIMDGDIIRRIQACREAINHVHTAGNPGRGELDDRQEINYAPIIKALADVGYEGYVGQEFIPTRDPLESLSAAVALCDQ